jgi:nucleoside phosphorylase
MRKTLTIILLGTLLGTTCKSQTVLEELKGRDVVLFVADEDEISPADVPFPVVFTGMGKMRMFSALVKWHDALPEGSHPVVLNIGSAGSAKYPIGTIVNCTRFFNGGCELVHDCIELSADGASVFSGDYFMSTQTFSPEQVKALSQEYDLFDMEAYAAAQFCKMYDIPFYCLKAVSDNLDGNLKDWRSILADIRFRFTALLNAGDGSDRECDLD